MTKRVRQLTMTLLLFLPLGICQCVSAAEQYELNSNSQPDYRPFQVEFLKDFNYPPESSPHFMENYVELLPVGAVGADLALFLSSHNAQIGVDESPRFIYKRFPPLSTTDDDPVSFNICDWKIYYDTILNAYMILAVGVDEDLIVLQRLELLSDSGGHQRIIVFQCKPDRIDDLSISTIRLMLIQDYDYDGQLEAFISVQSNSLGFKRLYCFDLTQGKLEWSLDNTTYKVLPLNDEKSPAILLTTQNPKNGIGGEHFEDTYGYLAIIDDSGRPIKKIILAENHFGVEICGLKNGGQFLVCHEIRPADHSSEIVPSPDSFYISKINSKGQFLKTIVTSEMPMQISILPQNHFGDDRIMVIFRDDLIRIYDSELDLVAIVSKDNTGTKYFGVLSLFDSTVSHYVFEDGIYDEEFQLVAKWPRKIYRQPSLLKFDTLNQEIHLLIETKYSWHIASIKEKHILDLASVFYHNNQIYILMLLSGLLVGLLASSIYQRRSKKSLDLIARQKSELEQTHANLIETQEALIEAEKYKQAKDIAGGFAHEIRNALFPADGLLTKLRRARNKERTGNDTIPDYHRDVHKAISRAIDITELISDYTRLDTEYYPESTDVDKVISEVIEDNRLRIDESDVMITVEGADSLYVRVNRKQLRIVMNNLLLNSLDALGGRPDPKVKIRLEKTDGSVEVRFIDNGVGIPHENAGRVFETFFSTKPNTGTGLGLSTVRKIIEMYAGTISVCSVPGVETEFTIRLPFAETIGRN